MNKFQNFLSGTKQKKSLSKTSRNEDASEIPELSNAIYRDRAETAYSIDEAPGETLTSDMLGFLTAHPGWCVQSTDGVMAVWKETNQIDELVKGFKNPWKPIISPTKESLTELLRFSLELQTKLTRQK